MSVYPDPGTVVRPKSAGVMKALESAQFAGESWSFIYLAKSQGPKAGNDFTHACSKAERLAMIDAAQADMYRGRHAAKDSVLTTITTVGVINALMLSFVVPSLSSFPSTLLNDDDPDQVTRLWFWLSFLSVVMSIISLILATIILTYFTPVPPKGVVEYLAFIHLPFSICALTFILSHSYITRRDFWIAVGILLTTYYCLIAYFAVVDRWSSTSNVRFYQMWIEERKNKGGDAVERDNES